ncbi:MAG: hypothetical protein IJS89_06580 [Bacteroidaceae bacterium]|nr:hypothetical protein [Bacteroidaceae bacterium]
MEKKTYTHPAVETIGIHTQHFMTDSVNGVGGNSGIGYGGAGTGPARTRRLDGWTGE